MVVETELVNNSAFHAIVVASPSDSGASKVYVIGQIPPLGQSDRLRSDAGGRGGNLSFWVGEPLTAEECPPGSQLMAVQTHEEERKWKDKARQAQWDNFWQVLHRRKLVGGMSWLEFHSASNREGWELVNVGEGSVGISKLQSPQQETGPTK